VVTGPGLKFSTLLLQILSVREKKLITQSVRVVGKPEAIPLAFELFDVGAWRKGHLHGRLYFYSMDGP